MATVYFVREGTGESATDAGRDVSLATITNALKNNKAIWSKEAPSLGSQTSANAVSEFRFVVIHVKNGETDGNFNKAGYWLLEDVSPSEFENSLARK